MPFVTARANALLDKILRAVDFTPMSTRYISLHTGDPGDTGTNECTGGSYARQTTTFDAAATKHTQNAADINFTGMPACTVTHVGIWDSLTTGVFWWGGALGASKSPAAGDTVKIAAGDLDITLT